MPTMLATSLVDAPAGLAVALGIGLLLGAERERRKGSGPDRGPAGVRTFALVAVLGGLSLRVGGVTVVAVAGAFVGLAAIAAYIRSDEEDPGLTTEVAVMVTFLLGALAQRDLALAAGIAVAVAIVLAFRERLHRLVRDVLSEQELHDGLIFAAAALIVLPLVPDEGLGPHGAFNPFTVWRLVVIVMAVQGAGYVALRLIGPRIGLLLTGFVGGFVSSTATVATMGARSKDEPRLTRATVGAAVVSTVATVVLLAIVLAATSPPVLRRLAVPLLLAGLAAALYAALVAVRVLRSPAPADVDRGRAFDLRTAVVLAALVSGVLVLSAVLEDALGERGVVLATAIGGLADSQSAAIAAASLAESGNISVSEAVVPVLAALSTNTISKAVVAGVFGRRSYAVEVWIGLALVIGAAWAGWALVEAV